MTLNRYGNLYGLPRLDLHRHLDGSLTRGCIEELIGRDVSEEELRAEEDCKNLAQYLEKFELPLQCLQTEHGLKRAALDFMESASKEGLSYVEVRFAPLLSGREGLTTDRVIDAVLEGMKAGRKTYGTEFGVIVCAMRHEKEEDNLSMLKTAREFLGDGVCAADLAGDEATFPMENFRNLFEAVKKMEMPFTIHAGECGRAENIVQAVTCGAARIGHGIAMKGNRKVMELCRDKKTGIEMCPVSNLQTKAVQRIDEYPIQEFLKAGVCVTWNTDNTTVSGTNIEKEIQILREFCGITPEQEYKMTENAIEVSFAAEEVKQKLFRSLERAWKAVE